MGRPTPFIKPTGGGASFPVFTSGCSLRALPWGAKGDDLILVLQFDFSQIANLSGIGLSGGSGFSANNVAYNSLFIDPRPLFGTRIPQAFKSLLISADFNPGNILVPPYAPISFAESSLGQLLYLTNRSQAAQYIAQTNVAYYSMDSKASACFDLISQPGAEFCFSQTATISNLIGPNQPVAAGVAILSTFRMQPFFTNS